MNLQQPDIQLVVASPSDTKTERRIVTRIASEISDDPFWPATVRILLWETDSSPGFHVHGPQGRIDRNLKITDADVVVIIFKHRFGSPVYDSSSGTKHEFELAYQSWKEKNSPQIMTYFCSSSPPSAVIRDNLDAVEQYLKLLKFKQKEFPQEGFWGEYETTEDFADKVTKDLKRVLKDLLDLLESTREVVSADTDTARVSLQPTFTAEDFSDINFHQLLVPGTNLYSSFQPRESGARFLRMRMNTTLGIDVAEALKSEACTVHSKNRVRNFVYVIRDPIRPFEIQIGEQRSQRDKLPKSVPPVAGLTIDVLKGMYPFIKDKEHRWLRMVFAELATDPEVVAYLYNNEIENENKDIRAIAAKNPSAPDAVKQESCVFCDDNFLNMRDATRYVIDDNTELQGVVFANDFPYGPFFHYIALPAASVHSWSDVKLNHLRAMNISIWRHLQNKEVVGNAAGVRIGLNSSIRHLIMGKTTWSSAGATIDHVHKQFWGMAGGALNLGDHIDKICRAYRKGKSIDYLESYYQALKDVDYVIWEDQNCILYIPMAQMAVHELQIMARRKGVCNYRELSKEEVESFSKAEYIATTIYKNIDINSFNEVLLATPFEHSVDETFRLIGTLIPREVDIAVSELHLLYVVDQHPYNTRDQIKVAKKIINQDLAEYNLELFSSHSSAKEKQ